MRFDSLKKKKELVRFPHLKKKRKKEKKCTSTSEAQNLVINLTINVVSRPIRNLGLPVKLPDQ